ncbi:MAG: hypothetical protein WC759_04775 [Candidatus Micrarchaeia archaeon]|jgi:hypothetical protein
MVVLQAAVLKVGPNNNAAYMAALQRSVQRHGPDLGGSPQVREFRAFVAVGNQAPKAAQNKYGEVMEKIENNPHQHSDAYLDNVGIGLGHALKAGKPAPEGIQH